MASKLPTEILANIASRLKDDNPRIGPYALINKSWQAVIEAEIYRSLLVLSPSSSDFVVVNRLQDHPVRRKKGLTIERLEAITSGNDSTRSARRAAIRTLDYLVAVPHRLEDNIHGKKEGYTYDNTIRRENNAAFRAGIQSIFQYLGSWTDKKHPIRLEVSLHAEHVYSMDQVIEPTTYSFMREDGLDEDDFETRKNNRLAPYQAVLAPETNLAAVNCVYAIEFNRRKSFWTGIENGISPSSALYIASACGATLREVLVYSDAICPLNEADLALEERNSTVQALRLLPPVLEDLSISWGASHRDLEEFGVDYPPPPPENDFFAEPDTLYAALHERSLRTRWFHLDGFEIPPEFLQPPPTAVLAEPACSRLEVLLLTGIPFTTPAGAHLRFFVSSRYLRMIEREGRVPYFSPLGAREVYDEFFDAFYENAGRAALSMPWLKRLLITHGSGQRERWDDSDQRQVLDFETTDSGGSELFFESSLGYSPSREVLKAWRFSGEPKLCYPRLEIKYDHWPPV